MGLMTKVQVIRRGVKNRQFYLICPAPLAHALELVKGEEVEWLVEDKQTLILKRRPCDPQKPGREDSGGLKADS
jgi:hypothetical protein